MMPSISSRGISFGQLDGQSLAVTSHGPDADTQTVDGNRGVTGQNLICFGESLPLFLGHPVIHGLVDPGDQASRQRGAELIRRQTVASLRVSVILSVQFQNGGGGVEETLFLSLPERPSGQSVPSCSGLPAPEAAW